MVNEPEYFFRPLLHAVRPRAHRARILSDNHQLVMDSLPQELIDAIIDNVPEPSPPIIHTIMYKVPKSSLLSCSLVAKRWQRKSQQLAFDTIVFSSEYIVNRWCKNIPQGSDGILSYVRHARFERIHSWNEPALFSRILGNLSSLTALSVCRTKIPDELPDHISRGEFGKGITALYLRSPNCTVATTRSVILSLPNLKKLRVSIYEAKPEESPPIHSIAPQRGPLDSLELDGDADGIRECLVKSRFISSRLSLDVRIADVGQLILLSSDMVVELKLCGVWFCGFSDQAETIVIDLPDTSIKEIPPPVHLPPLPALTTLVIYLGMINPSPCLTNVLYSIGSAPALTSITIENLVWKLAEPRADPWGDMDRWLSQTAKHARIKGSFPLTLMGWPEEKSLGREFLPKFRESGGEIELRDWRYLAIRRANTFPSDSFQTLHVGKPS